MFYNSDFHAEEVINENPTSAKCHEFISSIFWLEKMVSAWRGLQFGAKT